LIGFGFSPISKGTLADFKNDLLFNRFGINYAKLPAMYRKGSVIVKKDVRLQQTASGISDLV
jgi:tRNA(His) guanylyltransferase